MKKLGFILLMLLPALVFSTPPQWKILPNSSQLTFTALQNNAPVSAEFKIFSGEIWFDSKDLPNSRVMIEVDISSLAAPYKDLVTTLLDKDWFDTKMFPKAIYKSTSIVYLDGDRYLAKGVLTLRDKSAPVDLHFMARPLKPNKMVAVGNATLNRTAFGVGRGEWASTDEVADKVTVYFKINAINEDIKIVERKKGKR